MRRLLPVLLVAACAPSNADIVRDLEERAMEQPRPRADRLLARDPPLALRSPPPAFTLRMEGGGAVPIARGRVNGEELDLLVDTGASHVALSGAAARRTQLYMPPAETHEVFSPGYAVPFRAGVFDSLGLGDAAFGEGVALVAVRGMDRPYDGVLGMSALSHFRLTFDFDARQIHFEPHGAPGYADTLFTRIEIDGKPYLLMVDSGATHVFLEPWAALELGIITPERAEWHASKAIEPGRARFTWVRLKSVSVAHRTFENVSAAVVNTFEGQVSDEGYRPAGLLGLAGLGRLRWTLDCATRELTVDG